MQDPGMMMKQVLVKKNVRTPNIAASWEGFLGGGPKMSCRWQRSLQLEAMSIYAQDHEVDTGCDEFLYRSSRKQQLLKVVGCVFFYKSGNVVTQSLLKQAAKQDPFPLDKVRQFDVHMLSFAENVCNQDPEGHLLCPRSTQTSWTPGNRSLECL